LRDAARLPNPNHALDRRLRLTGQDVLPHWKSVIRPLLVALDGSPIVEIGAESGQTTEKLLELAAERDAIVHSIDPEPRFDVAALDDRRPGRLRFHREKSLDALEKIEPPAAAIIDGDHNWYTVHGELTRLEEIAASGSRPFPLVILHDVEWPYARRDMYYDPEAVPEEWRQPWARRGISLGERLLDQTDGGFNSHLANALEEGGARNGVLTAVEDFMETCSAPLELRIVHGHAGLGILVSTDLLDANPALSREWERLHSPEFLLAQTKRLSQVIMRSTVARLEAEHHSPEPESAGEE